MKKFCLIGALLFVALPMGSTAEVDGATPSTAEAEPQTPCFGDAFRNRVEHGIAGYADVVNIPGISYGIVRGDALIYSGGVGYADRSSKRVATASTPYNIASVTKVFTATLAMMLVNEGALDLDLPISNYLPAFVRMPRDARGRAITVRSLLTHTAGFLKQPPNRRNQKLEGPLDPGLWEAYNVSELYEGLAVTELQTEVGEQFLYSNYGYALLGHIVERVSARPYEQVLRERLLEPLDMPSTAISLNTAQQHQLAAFYWSEDPARTEQRAHARFGEVAGFIGLTSTVRDLARFAAAHLNPSDNPSNPIPRNVITQMQQPRIDLDEDATSKNEMGYGWFLVTQKISETPVILQHFGNVDGHSSGLLLNPAEKIGVIVLQNIGGRDGDVASDYLGFWLIELASKEQKSCRS